MGLRHDELRVEGVQFHPESVLTREGKRLVGNWLKSSRRVRGARAGPSGAPTGPSRKEPGRERDFAAPGARPAAGARAGRRRRRARRVRGDPRRRVDAGPDRRVRRGAAHARRDAPRPSSAAAEAMRGAMTVVEHGLPLVVDTCGTGGDGSHTLNLSTRGRRRRRGVRRAGGQARQPLRLEPLRQRRRLRGPGHPARRCPPTAQGELLREVGHRVPVRPGPPPGAQARGAGAPRARDAHHLQRARAPRQPGARDAPARRRLRRRAPAHRSRAPSGGSAASAPGWSAARTGSTR